MEASDPCPCGGYEGAVDFGTCCRPFVVDATPPLTCEQLMRSRYSAFATKNAEHLWRTWHPRTRPATVADLDGVTWQRLDVLAATGGGAHDTEGTVDFAAQFETDSGERGLVREHSRFTRRAGRWFYLDGEELV